MKNYIKANKTFVEWICIGIDVIGNGAPCGASMI